MQCKRIKHYWIIGQDDLIDNLYSHAYNLIVSGQWFALNLPGNEILYTGKLISLTCDVTSLIF